MDKDFWLQLKEQLLNFLIEIGPEIIYAVVGFIIGIFLIKVTMNLLKRTLKRSRVELSLKTFVESLSVFLLYGLLIFIIGSILGIKTTSFIAVFGAAGIAIALALQGSLANFAGGVLILVFKPFKVGDLIHVNNNLGYVQKIDILYTRIKTFDGRMITMPNGNVSNSDVDNRTMEPYRRIDLNLKFSFETDIDTIRQITINALKKHPKLVKDLPVDIRLDEIGEYEMKLKARCWVESTEYWPVFWEQLEAVKKALDQNGIEIPIPKRAVYQGVTSRLEEK
ncbi:mechanosensitive ion channel family protein [Marixanthomonas ophiurae]|uniref:Mechanosensitive ion channel family protein n=1 Tax=Marixanthomonas ophiurae TaxID=387659 RepID=A0A3E1Q888_9FLAO|nr:mechanosensitive ion channel domain-containing protein [Marixanthomonas ophiurae]RFN58349.1 mechanosensitive ion channel family protein [Marixanthomonas ophiurae]